MTHALSPSFYVSSGEAAPNTAQTMGKSRIRPHGHFTTIPRPHGFSMAQLGHTNRRIQAWKLRPKLPEILDHDMLVWSFGPVFREAVARQRHPQASCWVLGLAPSLEPQKRRATPQSCALLSWPSHNRTKGWIDAILVSSLGTP